MAGSGGAPSGRRGIVPGALAIGAFGAYALTGQTLLVREVLVAFHGNELSLGIVFAAWLAGVGGGALASRPLARSRGLRASAAFAGVLVWLGLVLPVQLAAARGLRTLLGTPWGEFPPIGQVAAAGVAIVVPSSAAIGFGFAFACRTAVAAGAAGPIGLAYGLESLGSLLGGAAVTYLLLPALPVYGIAGIASAIAWAGALAIALRPPDGPPVRWAAGAASLLLASVAAGWLAGGITSLEDASLRLRWRPLLEKGRRLLASRDTPYQNLALLSAGGRRLLYADGDRAFALPDTPAEEEAHAILAQHPAPRRVLLVGGSPGLVREALKHRMIERLDLVLFDPAVLEVLRPHLDEASLSALEDRRLRIAYTDARPFVRGAPAGAYDAIILDVPEPSTASRNRLYTREFFRDARAALAPEGFLTLAVTSSVRLGEEAAGYAASIYWTLRAVFPRVLVTFGSRNRFFAGGERSAITFDCEVLKARFASRGIEARFFDALYFLGTDAYDPDKTRKVRERLEATRSRPNEDLRPRAYLRNLVLWARYTGSESARWLRRLRGLPAWAAVAALAAPAVLVLAWRALRRRRGPPLAWAIGTTGLAGMSLEIAVLLAYQTASGALYRKVGLIVALFMAGIAAGSLGGRRGSVSRRALLAADAAVFALATATIGVAAVAVRRPGAAEPLLGVWVALIGAATGWEFAIAGRIGGPERGEAGRRGAVLEAADHVGAAVGAGVTGVVLVPVFGIAATCATLAAVKAASVALLAVCGREGAGGTR